MLFGVLHQTRLYGIHPDVCGVLRIVSGVSDPVFVVTLLPYLMAEVILLRCAIGESPLDELHGFLKRYQGSRCKNQVNVISHEDELVYVKPLFSSILMNYVQQQIAQGIGLQYESSLQSGERGEESTCLLRCNQHAETGSHMIRRQPGRPVGAPAFMREGALQRSWKRAST